MVGWNMLGLWVKVAEIETVERSDWFGQPYFASDDCSRPLQRRWPRDVSRDRRALRVAVVCMIEADVWVKVAWARCRERASWC